MDEGKKIFFVGIGGISMSGLAELAKARGLVVEGSDLTIGNRSKALREKGIPVHSPHLPENIDRFRPDALVYTAAIPQDNPELVRARELGIPTIERSDWLGLINRRYPEVINVAGTNGKSSVTAMCAYICMDQGLDPTVHLGAELDRFHSTIHIGGEKLMLSEACEFNYSFLSFYSTITTVLNLGHDHVDLFPEMSDVIHAFALYVAGLETGTKLVLPSFDPYMPALLAEVRRLKAGQLEKLDLYYFGYPEDRIEDREKADLLITDIQYKAGLPVFRLHYRGEDLGYFELRVPGKFNVENAAAALLLCHLAGADFIAAKGSIREFRGAEGRFTICGRYRGALVINDYAHHPDSVKKTIEATKEIPHRRLFACFQPITFSRAKGLADGFVEAMKDEAHPILMEIYDDREKNRSFSSKDIADRINDLGGSALYMPTLDALEAYLRKEAGQDDIILLMGQNIRDVGDRLAERSNHFSEHLSL